MNTKQVIVVRKDLNMRKGKMCAQASHASMAFLTKNIEYSGRLGYCYVSFGYYEDEINHWLENSFRKIVCYVESEQALDELHQKALDAGLISHMVVDNGATEFGGVLTKTCIAIGPHTDAKFEGITDHLPLL